MFLYHDSCILSCLNEEYCICFDTVLITPSIFVIPMFNCFEVAKCKPSWRSRALFVNFRLMSVLRRWFCLFVRLFNVLPIVCGSSLFDFVLLCITLCLI